MERDTHSFEGYAPQGAAAGAEADLGVRAGRLEPSRRHDRGPLDAGSVDLINKSVE